MANSYFDTNVLYPLERPSVTDLNQLQSQNWRTARFLERLRYGYDLSTVYSGFVNSSFLVQRLFFQTGLDITLSRGIGYIDTSDSVTNIDGVPGLNDLSSYKPIVLSADRFLTVPDLPAAGMCRRDLIEVRWKRALEDVSNLDIYDPTSQNFSSTGKPKTLTYDLLDETMHTYDAGVVPASDAYLIYKRGYAVPYTNDSSFSSAMAPAVDDGCLAVAVINLKHTDTSVQQDQIIDKRKLLSNERQFIISGTATLGRVDNSTQELSDVVINAPVGLRCCISKKNQYDQTPNELTLNQYQFFVLGPKLQSLTPTFSVFSDALIQSQKQHSVIMTINAIDVAEDGLSVTGRNMVKDPTYSSPYLSSAALGQQFSSFTFCINTNVTDVGLPTYLRRDAALFGSNPDLYTVRVSFVIVGQYAA